MTEKFTDILRTVENKERAFVDLKNLKTLWFNTGTRCNLSCDNCYIESSPTNNRLEYISTQEVTSFLDEARTIAQGIELIALTGGEPFLNPHIIPIITETLKRDYNILILTNAFRVIDRYKENLSKLKDTYGDKLHIRVSLDHYSKEVHEQERGEKTFDRTLENIKWLYDKKFNVSIAGRSLKDEDLSIATREYEKLLSTIKININLKKNKLVIFPEMDTTRDVPEISVECWDILNKKPEHQMCATERMIVKREGAQYPTVLPCTLIAYDKSFDLGQTLKSSKDRVYLKHKFCAQFCVLGGASCSTTK